MDRRGHAIPGKDAAYLHITHGMHLTCARPWKSSGTRPPSRSGPNWPPRSPVPLLAVMRDAGDQRGEDVALLDLGPPFKRLAGWDGAIVTEEQAVAIFAELRDRAGEGRRAEQPRRLPFSEVPGTRGDPGAARGGRGADRPRRHSFGQGAGQPGRVLAEDGQRDKAIAAFTDAVAEYRETRDRSGEGPPGGLTRLLRLFAPGGQNVPAG
jgi:hypothetical protein